MNTNHESENNQQSQQIGAAVKHIIAKAFNVVLAQKERRQLLVSGELEVGEHSKCGL